MTTPTRKCDIDLDTLVLKSGSHPEADGEYCVMEAVACIVHEPHSDSPASVSPVIGAFLRSWNDALNDADRQMLKPYILKVIGTATTPADEERRAWMATDWLVRVFTPTWLDLAGLTDHAAALRALPELSTDELAAAAQVTIGAAWNAAGSAARSAAWNAAWNAAGSAAESAARSAAWSAAWNAAWNAAGSAAWSAAWNAAGSAAWNAAWNAAGSAAESAADKALAPTVVLLQQSALSLLDRLIAVGKVEVPV